ncbi:MULTISPECIES: SDR family oxidoreductase [Ralstonia]|jgi:NAD(P)-dependent dehydrogenase (short-subunit alcohol dehydrogenase family)|uniref:Short chain dehydrogenase n=2 Tax=Ralstonia pickettii TaxID=329 RepID=A0ABM9IR26_RALPI|nr:MULTISPECIES: SDR family oxidoreductase [Ralstonia]MBA4200816.1 short chain dehydrogenase [Ralstonia sp.]MBA4230619.1 short chain dehydrogenase [Ralstonia sp.]MBA4237202.1 short chain dehydrogenase [Ralstonia sp.]MBA4281346.1 short chain dehydrogenase [Ralstonia sp.]MBA4297945.1 short chain dehydrogenase [Ralstonia sp.]
MTNATSRRTRTALILGASRGIGLETVKQYRTDGWRVIATVRSQAAAEELQALGAETHVLDLTDANAVAGLAWKLDGEALDVAIYVAGIYGPRTQGATPVSQADFDAVMHTNVWGPMNVLPAVLPMVEAGRNGVDEPGGVLAVISSRMGSIGDMESNGGWLYRASKAAVNAVLRAVSIDAKNATCLTFHPGWVQTDMGGAGAAITPQQSVAGIRRVIAGATRADNGGFRNYDGSVIEW